MEHDAMHSRARTREALSVSAVVHLLIFVWLGLHRAGAGELAGLTEVTFVDVTDPNGLADAAPPMARETTSGSPVQQVSMKASREGDPQHFQRAQERGENAPLHQSSRAVTDILNERLDAIDKNGSSTTRMASLIPAPNVGIPAPAGLPGPGKMPNAVPAVLHRDAAPPSAGTAPVALRRLESNPAPAPVMAAAMLERPAQEAEAPAPASAIHVGGGTRNLAGANLVGPVADRTVKHYRVPDYPEWAKRDGTEGSVTLYFFVLPDGRVKENVLVERTSGFSDFDDRAVAALLQWKFVSLPLSNEQWGRITFDYKLNAN